MSFDLASYAEQHLSGLRTSTGPEIEASCPQCEKPRGFYLNTETGAFICFKCDFKGKSAVGLIAHIEGVSWAKARAFLFKQRSQLRRKTNIFTLGDKVASLRLHAIRDDVEEVSVSLPKGFIPCYRNGKYSMPVWLTRDRGVTRKTARAWSLGYCNSGRLAHRLIIPFGCPNGYSFTARAIPADMEPKYWNPREVDQSRLLIGWEHANLSGEIIICEGPFDAIMLWQHGYSAMALGGKVLHDEQLEMLVANVPYETPITVMLDPEEKDAPKRVAQLLSPHFATVYMAKLPDGIDPGSSTRDVATMAIERSKRWNGVRSYNLDRFKEWYA